MQTCAPLHGGLKAEASHAPLFQLRHTSCPSLLEAPVGADWLRAVASATAFEAGNL